MINQIILAIVGLVGGVLGGMGMGGGTALIPLLTIFCSVSQKHSQAINLISFIPMAIVALIIHAKNKLIKKEGVLFIVIPAVIFALLGSVISSLINSSILKRIFGGFLIVLSVLEFFSDKISKKISSKSKLI